MSETIDTARPRKRDAEGTRGRILAAAMTRFARFGYEGTSLRDISADAGADVALVSRYFGGKEGLFTEALKASFNPRGLTDRDRRRYAREMAERLAGDAHADDEAHHRFQFLLRAATSPATAPLLNVAVQERFLGPIRDWLGGEDAQPRARVLAAVIIGLLVERLIRGSALEGREREIFVERATAIISTLVSTEEKGRALANE